MQPRRMTIIAIILLTVLSRFIPHPPNFTPVIAIGLFGGAYFNRKILAIAVPMVAMFVSDYFLGFHTSMIFVYLSLTIIVGFGILLQSKLKIGTVIGASIGSAILFYLITNFGVWAIGAWYPKTIDGLIACYIAGIPFLKNTSVSSLLYTGVIFGAFELLKRTVPALQPITIKNK
ncbi:MAG: hypothetical protein H8E71_06640 [Candidatus Marinimicrobia bacterium]|nr:hypothetical protein [Candidatus Neomarinimicrobiota bacterium]